MFKSRTPSDWSLFGAALLVGLAIVWLAAARRRDSGAASDEPAVRGTSSSTALPGREWPSSFVPRPREITRSALPLRLPRLVRVDARAAFLARQGALVDLRQAIWWRLWDGYGDVGRTCAAESAVSSLCWYRVRVKVTSSVTVGPGSIVECRARDVLAPLAEETQHALERCVQSSLGPVDGVGVSAGTAALLEGFDGTIDVEIAVESGRGPPLGE